MNAIQKWLADHNFSSHTIVSALVGATTIYSTNADVYNLVNSTLAAHPKVLAWVGVLVGAVLKYSGGHSTQGQVKELASKPTAQVAEAVQTAIQSQPDVAENIAKNAAAAKSAAAQPLT